MLLLFEQAPRLLEDHRGLQALAAEADWLSKVEWTLSDKGEVCVNFDIVVGPRTYEAVLIFAGMYPDVPAFVRPRNVTERWSIHQYPSTGTLCLEWGPDNWRSDTNAADLVRSTYRLLVSESAGALRIPVPSRHSLTLGQQLRGKSWRLHLPGVVRNILVADQTAPMAPLIVHTSLRFWELIGYVSEVNGVSLAKGAAPLPPEAVDGFLGGWYARQGWVLHCDEFASLAADCTVPVFKEFVAAKGHAPPWAEVKTSSAFVILVDVCKRVRAVSVPTDEAANVSEYTLFDGEESVQKRVPHTYASLADKKVAIVGLGSVGSKLAVSLARSGVSNFLLVDDDVVLPENLSRNQLDWLSIGFSKAEASKGAIQLVNPSAEVSSRVVRVAAQESASSNAAVLEAIATCDLVIDATADVHVFNSLAAMCRRRERILVWGEVFAGGIGALMGRSVPGRDADPLTVRAALNSYLETLPDAPFKTAGGYDDAEVSGQPLVAGDAEVSQLAASMTAFAIDALVGKDRPRFPVAAYLFGFADTWSAFTAPFDTHAIDCPKANQTPQEDEGRRLEAFKELANVFAKGTNADCQPTE